MNFLSHRDLYFNGAGLTQVMGLELKTESLRGYVEVWTRRKKKKKICLKAKRGAKEHILVAHTWMKTKVSPENLLKASHPSTGGGIICTIYLI